MLVEAGRRGGRGGRVGGRRACEWVRAAAGCAPGATSPRPRRVRPDRTVLRGASAGTGRLDCRGAAQRPRHSRRPPRLPRSGAGPGSEQGLTGPFPRTALPPPQTRPRLTRPFRLVGRPLAARARPANPPPPLLTLLARLLTYLLACLAGRLLPSLLPYLPWRGGTRRSSTTTPLTSQPLTPASDLSVIRHTYLSLAYMITHRPKKVSCTTKVLNRYNNLHDSDSSYDNKPI